MEESVNFTVSSRYANQKNKAGNKLGYSEGMTKKQQGTRGGEVPILLKSTSHNLKIIHPADVGPGRRLQIANERT